jgi:putative transposase
MRYNPELHHRQSIRWRGYDFVTICTHERELTLARPAVADLVTQTWHALPTRFLSIELDEFIIMPNHVHGIIVLRGESAKLGAVIRAFKSISAIAAKKVLGRSEAPFWQRNYYEHVIRTEGELNAIRQYIRDNPLGWNDDPDNPAVVEPRHR